MERHSKGGRKAGTGGLTMLGESPCDNCLRGLEHCKKNRLACGDYLHYMKKGAVIKRDRAPTADCYLRIQASGKTKHQQKISAGQKKGRTKKESLCKKEGSQTQSNGQESHPRARIKAYITKNKRRITQILIDETGILNLIEKEISAETQGLRRQIIIIT